MPRNEKDSDTLERVELTELNPTSFDSAPDAETIHAGHADFTGSDDETHALNPRVWSPLKVCPQCSLAWESDGDWCPSCGTAFDRSKERVQATRVMPAERQRASQASTRPRRPGEPPLSRSGRRNPPPPAGAQRQRQRQASAAPPPRSGVGASIAKALAIFAVFAVATTAAFYIGQQSRPSQAEVDQRIEDATQTARNGAVESLKRLQAKFEEQRAAAVAKARQQGRDQAAAENEAERQASDSLIDQIGRCIVDFNC